MVIRFITIFSLFLTVVFANPTIEVVKKVSSTVKVSLHSNTDKPHLSSLDKELNMMIRSDLKVAGIFKIVDDPAVKVDYEISYSLQRDDKQFKVEFLVKEEVGETIFKKNYKFSKEDRYPFLSHRFVVDLSYKFGVYDLDWMEKLVVFSNLTAPGESEILISDYSLTFRKAIIKGGINSFPKWADKEQNSFYYTKYEDSLVLYRYDLATGQKKKIISGDGMLVCSDVSDDGKRLLVTMSNKGQPDIYEINLETKKRKRVTKYGGIDVNGNYIEDDSSFVFVSDRFGYPEIFKGSITDNFVEQLVFKGRNNNYVDAYKSNVIFVSRDTNSEFGRNTFNVYLISTKTDYIRQLTSTGQNYFPRFSDDGNTILYIKSYKNESALGVIRLNQNRSFLFPLKSSKIQSLDW